jgi:His-Xaa-Ser system radical SAM maturase HxsC
MITLSGRVSWIDTPAALTDAVWLLADHTTLTSQRSHRAYVMTRGASAPPGFELYICRSDAEHPPHQCRPCIRLPASLDYLAAGDVIALDARRGRVRAMWRDRSPLNSILLTERCNHYCLMCSQPPKVANDDHLLDDARQLIRLLPQQTTGFAITGGEPTIYGDGLVDLLKLARNLLPHTGIHILSNGRRFSDPAFADAYASVRHPDMMVGIPIYGAEPALHDYVVQSHGAFDETIRGILNLAERGQRVEIRVVIHKQTASQLPAIAEFLARNLTFVDQVALMGLEMVGLARANVDTLWIDPVDYQSELVEAVRLLDRRRIRTLIYNHQLCLLDRELWPFAVRSISDWKNEYHPECTACSVQHQCGGFFFSAKYKHSEHIRAIRDPASEPALLQLQ